MDKNRFLKLLSMAVTIVTIVTSIAMLILVLTMDKAGAGITNSQFSPIRFCMFASGVPSLVKFYISASPVKENKIFFALHVISLACWLIFGYIAFSTPYFTNIRTSVFTSNILVAIGVYLEWAMVSDK